MRSRCQDASIDEEFHGVGCSTLASKAEIELDSTANNRNAFPPLQNPEAPQVCIGLPLIVMQNRIACANMGFLARRGHMLHLCDIVTSVGACIYDWAMGICHRCENQA